MQQQHNYENYVYRCIFKIYPVIIKFFVHFCILIKSCDVFLYCIFFFDFVCLERIIVLFTTERKIIVHVYE
jgi:hypothetical protein